MWRLQPGHHALNLSTWREFQSLQDSSQNMARNFIHNSRKGTKGPWFCLLTLIIWSHLNAFLCFFMFSLLWLNLFFGQIFPQTKAGRGHVGWAGRPKCPAWLQLETRSDLVRREIGVWMHVEDRDPGRPHICRNTNDDLKEIGRLFLPVLMFMGEKGPWGEGSMDRGV